MTDVAVVGCGAIAHEHLTALRNIPGVRIAAVCDTSPALAAAVGAMYASNSIHVDLETMLAEVQPNVLHVLTPPHTHERLVTMGLDHGCHVLCEKPITLEVESLDRLFALAELKGLMLMESQNLRYNDVILAIDHLVSSGALGDIREVDISLRLDLTAGPLGDLNLADTGGSRLPGGAVHDFLPHLVYLYLHFANDDETPLDAACGELANRSGNATVGYDSLDVLARAGSVRGRLHIASDLAPDAFRLAVRGTERSVETDLYNPFLRLEGGKSVGKFAPLEQVTFGTRLIGSGIRNLTDKVRRHDTMHGLPRMLERFYVAVQAQQPAPISPRSIRATAVSIDQILTNARRVGPDVEPVGQR